MGAGGDDCGEELPMVGDHERMLEFYDWLLDGGRQPDLAV